jgi:hypothetical protein
MIAPHRLIAALLFGLAGLAACVDPAEPPAIPPVEVGIVLNSVDNSITVFVSDEGGSFTIGLGADGTPTALAASEGLAAVPLGMTPAVAVVDLQAGAMRHTIPLPQGSGASGIAMAGGGTAVVSNPGLNSVSVLNLVAGERLADIAVGPYPEAIVVEGPTAYVVNRHLGADFLPTGPASVTVVDLGTREASGTIPLSGTNPGSAVLHDGRLYVLHAGRWGMNDGSLSIVNPATRTETLHVEGFGNFPGSLTVGPTGLLHVGSFSYGIAIWEPVSRAFVRDPDQAVQPGGATTISDVGFDADGRLYAVRPYCVPGQPDRVLRLDTSFAVEREIVVGNCPTAILFTDLEND